MADEDEVALVSSTPWRSMRAEGGYQEIDSRKALWMLENLGRRPGLEVRAFASEARLGNCSLDRMRDHEVLKLICDAIRDGRVIAVERGGAKSNNATATAELRRLVAQVEKVTHSKLSYRGRQYKLVVDVDLGKIPGRDSYDVVSQPDAQVVLVSIAKESPPSAEPLRKASEKISKDWRPPFSEPNGLVLLRRIPVQATMPKDEGPAITPSQMKALLKKEKPDDFVLELEHLYHDDGPVYEAPFTVELSDGSTVKGQLDAEGKATIHLQVLPIRVQFGPDSRPWKKVDQTANPDFQEELDVDAFIDSHLESSS